MRIHHSLLALTLSSLVACVGAAPPSTGGGGTGTSTGSSGGDTGSDPGDTGSDGEAGSADPTAFLTGIATADCTEAFSCKASFVAQGSGDTFADEWGSSVSDCESGYWGDPDAITAAIAAGTITFDADDAATCVAGIAAAATCSAFWSDGNTYPDACSTAMVGTIADGGACTLDFECSNVESDCDTTTMKCTVASSFAPTTGARFTRSR